MSFFTCGSETNSFALKPGGRTMWSIDSAGGIGFCIVRIGSPIVPHRALGT